MNRWFPKRRFARVHGIGRHWLARDPIGENGGLNLYAYVSNNPANAVDPLGLWQITIGGGEGAGFMITFGNNGGTGSGWRSLFNGQWNLGGDVGVGLGGFVNVNLRDSGRHCSGDNWGVYGRASNTLPFSGGYGSVGGSAYAPFGAENGTPSAQFGVNFRGQPGGANGSAALGGYKVGPGPNGPVFTPYVGGSFTIGGGGVVGVGDTHYF